MPIELRLAAIEAASRRADRRAPARRDRHRAGVQPAQRAHGDGHGPGRGDGPAAGGPARHPGGAAHADRGEGGSDRQRPGGQGAGHGDGHAHPAPRRTAQARRRGRRRRDRGLPPVARREPAAARARRRRRRAADDRLRPGHRRPVPRADQIVVDLGGSRDHASSARRGPRSRCGTESTSSCSRPSSSARTAWTLYGFGESDERTVFEQVQTVSGIGPRIALALLATLTPDDLRRCRVPRRRGDPHAGFRDRAQGCPTADPGAEGPARACARRGGRPRQRDRPGAGLGAGSRPSPPGSTSLGWSAREAEQAVAAIPADVRLRRPTAAGGQADIGGLLKSALRALDRS